MTLAEAVKLSDEAADLLVFLFLVFLAIVALSCVAAVLGWVCAYRAGRGSNLALKGWIAAATPFVAAMMLPIPTMLAKGFNVCWLVPVSVLATQAALYGLGRAVGPRPTAVAPAGHGWSG